jgi:hypothetical protein
MSALLISQSIGGSATSFVPSFYAAVPNGVCTSVLGRQSGNNFSPITHVTFDSLKTFEVSTGVLLVCPRVVRTFFCR